ncbi:signal peptidase I [Nonomuraea typhae]|uniref:signal peptidase I n=1 Tax=Nonomuraea typhae TaxID=2603600 RepID=UPI0012FA7756|nr:signal peptidase I [Nonomuraea typhae]
MMRVAAALLSMTLLTGCGMVSQITGGAKIQVNSDAMEPTIERGTTVTAQPLKDGRPPKPGDIVAFKAPEWADGVFVYRVIGVPGNRVDCCDGQGRVVVDGKPLDEPYLQGMSPSSTSMFSVTVPPDRLWVLGDNRAAAADSRTRQDRPGGGTIAVSSVIGVVERPAG